MNIQKIQIDLIFEKAVRFMSQHLPFSEGRRKPILMHGLRVGFYLYENGYSGDVIAGGLLHDVLEFSNVSHDQIRNEFGQRVLDIVAANSQDNDIEDKDKKWQDMVLRCTEQGKDALIVKTADVLDSYQFYTGINNQDEIARSVSIGQFVIENLSDNVEDPIFEKLRKII